MTRYTVGERIIPLTEYNMTYVTYTPKGWAGYYETECDTKACVDAPRCVNPLMQGTWLTCLVYTPAIVSRK